MGIVLFVVVVVDLLIFCIIFCDNGIVIMIVEFDEDFVVCLLFVGDFVDCD